MARKKWGVEGIQRFCEANFHCNILTKRHTVHPSPLLCQSVTSKCGWVGLSQQPVIMVAIRAL